MPIETADHWECGLQQPFDEDLRKLADVFRISIDEIVFQGPAEQE